MMECYHITKHYLGLDGCVVVAAQYKHTEKDTSSSGTTLTRDVLFPALASLIQIEPMLSVKLVDERSRKRRGYARLDSIDLDPIVDFRPTLSTDYATLEGIMEEHASRSIDTTKDEPLWRLTVVGGSYLVFAWHHAIGDGRSGLAFHQMLYQILNSQAQAGMPPNSDVPSKIQPPSAEALPLLPPLEKLADLSVSFPFILKKLSSLFFSVGKSRVWSGNKVPTKFEDLQVGAEIISMDGEMVSKMLKNCRAHHVSLTSGIKMAAVSSLHSILTSQSSKLNMKTDRKQWKKVGSAVPVALRDNVSPTRMGDYVSIYPTEIKLQEFSWPACKEYDHKLHSHIKTAGREIGIAKVLFGRWEGFHLDKLGEKRETGIELSNLGLFKLKLPEVDGKEVVERWSIVDTLFGQNDAVTGSALKLNTVGGPKGNVNICLTWNQFGVSQEFVDIFTAKFKEELGNLMGYDNQNA